MERTIVPGKPIKHRYGFFEDDALVAMYVVFGQQKAKANLVEKIDNASRGLEASKRLWILLGPPGAAKSRSMDGIKTALNVYSASDEGKTFTLLLPTIDDRLKEKALFEENGIDKAMTLGYRHPMGPLRLTDLVGLDVRLAIAEQLHATLGLEAFRPPEILRKLVADGRLGKKSGRGFYEW